MERLSKYWVIVASKDHVERGLAGGFCQASHGKDAPLKRMKQGDGVVFYSPKEEYPDGQQCRRFTAIGKVSDDKVFKVTMNPDFHPFRRNVEFHSKAREVPIGPLLQKLSFTKDRGSSWGYAFRHGLFQITQADYQIIMSNMLSKRNDETENSVA